MVSSRKGNYTNYTSSPQAIAPLDNLILEGNDAPFILSHQYQNDIPVYSVAAVGF